ncbi:neuronal acetylcholine receptor subunit alpha-7-like, partial [Coregonus clupeaformis]|uniref:neuronal acetylcholine receptor subunit alpha-7-like n=1 Tax=Coregonus clupeaformis TaxID=59861 RepID=UPI001E1C65E5
MHHRKCLGYVYIAVYLWTAFCFKGCFCGQYQRKLYKDLLMNYNRLERPVFNDSSPILVELGLTLLQIIDVDEKNQVLMTNACTGQIPTSPGTQRTTQVFRTFVSPSNQIWVPDILLYNSQEADKTVRLLLQMPAAVTHFWAQARTGAPLKSGTSYP